VVEKYQLKNENFNKKRNIILKKTLCLIEWPLTKTKICLKM
jgi:hypothetical protein